jgi:hypothetical protein
MEPKAVSYEIARRYVSDTLQSGQVDKALLLKAHGALRARDLPTLASLSVNLDPALHRVEDYRFVLQFEAFFKKNTSFTDMSLAKENALKAFNEAEGACSETNRHITGLAFMIEGGLGVLASPFDRYLRRVKSNIASILGPVEPFIQSIPQRIRLTAGATSLTPRSRSQPFTKANMRVRTRYSSLPYIRQIADSFGYPLQVRQELSNRVLFVPKNWKTHRSIAAEPAGSLPLQLAFDSYAKERLALKGVDLSDQSWNQRLAMFGSITGDFATVDLKAASDTVALDVVRYLFPEEWLTFLEAVRSPCYTFHGDPQRRYTYHKFSSMGNGSTFCLETTLFLAVVMAIGADSEAHAVYGDDIIVHSRYVEDLIAMLNLLGFSVNQEKTHTDGLFRESCGSNWYCGIDITPAYIRKLTRAKATWCHLVNSMVKVSKPYGHVWDYMKTITCQMELPLGPWDDVSTSYVWIDVPSSYKRRLIRHKKSSMSPQVKRYVATTGRDGNIDCTDSRALFLWYLTSLRHEISHREQDEVNEQLRYVDSSTLRYRYKAALYWPPATSTPTQLYSWTDHLLA